MIGFKGILDIKGNVVRVTVDHSRIDSSGGFYRTTVHVNIVGEYKFTHTIYTYNPPADVQDAINAIKTSLYHYPDDKASVKLEYLGGLE